MPKIDLHCIPSPGYEKNMELMLSKVPSEFFDIHVADYIAGNISLARKKAYLKGTNEFKTFIDPDDELLDLGWINKALSILENKSIAAVAPRYKITYYNTNNVAVRPFKDWSPHLYREFNHPPIIHHTSIQRFENLEKIFHRIDSLNLLFSEQAICFLTPLYGSIKAIPEISYNWIVKTTGAHLLHSKEQRRITIELENETEKLIKLGLFENK